MIDPFDVLAQGQSPADQQHQQQQQRQLQQHQFGVQNSTAILAAASQQPARPQPQPYSSLTYNAVLSTGGSPQHSGGSANGGSPPQVAPLGAGTASTKNSSGRYGGSATYSSPLSVFPEGQRAGAPRAPTASDGSVGVYPVGATGGSMGAARGGIDLLQRQRQQQQLFRGVPHSKWSVINRQIGNNTTTLVPAFPVRPGSSPPAGSGVSTSGGDRTAEGAEWAPPGDQLGLYESMFAMASAGSAVPGTVSGAAAVQFFSRSRLPKDTMRKIWSLCDPELTGCIHRPGFFAAMRLLAIAQAGGEAPGLSPAQPISLTALEASRHAPLPPPRMEGFAFNVGSTRTPFPRFALSADPGLPSGLPSPTIVPGIASGSAMKAFDSLSGTGASPQLEGEGMSSPVLLSTAVPMVPVVATKAAAPLRGEGDMTAPAMQSVLGVVRIGGGANAFAVYGVRPAEDEEDDFGEFTAAEDAAPPSTEEKCASGITTVATVTNAEEDDDDDDFGDFSGAPPQDVSAPPEAAAAASATMAAAGDTRGAALLHPADDWTMGGGIGVEAAQWATQAAAGATSDGLDELIKQSLSSATTEPVHLANMFQQTIPPLLGIPHAPVMVDRASAARNKLSVFDAMADLDLAAEQEEWNDFADETTAPSSTLPSLHPQPVAPPITAEPPKMVGSPSHAAARANETRLGVVEYPILMGSDREKRADTPDLQRNPSLTGASPTWMPRAAGESPLTPTETSDEGAPAVRPVAGVISPVSPTSANGENQYDDWGDFEEAEGGAIYDGKSTGSSTFVGMNGVEKEETADDGDEKDVDSIVLDAAGHGDGWKEKSTASSVADSSLHPMSNDDYQLQDPVDFDPFADISPPTSQPCILASRIGANGEVVTEGRPGTSELDQEREPVDLDSVATGVATPAATVAVEAADNGGSVPLSLLQLRDGLASRGRLEEANEVQRKIELAVSEGKHRMAERPQIGAADGDDGGCSSNVRDEEREEQDLERWRAAMKLPPAVSLETLASAVSKVDFERGKRFRERFIAGRQSVEDEALSASGNTSGLAAALRRQRAAHRAAFLSAVLGKATSGGGKGGDGPEESCAEKALVEGANDGSDLEFDLGMGAGGSRNPPTTLLDWASMVSYVTRTAEAGLAALSKGHDECPSGATDSEETGAAAGEADVANGSAGNQASGGQSVTERGGLLPGEVARSAQFETFARGLREGVRVCRLLQAAAEDCLETIEGFQLMEATWKEFMRCAREAATAVETRTENSGDVGERVEFAESDGQQRRTSDSSSRSLKWGQDVERIVGSDEWGGAIPTVNFVRDVILTAPASSTLCAVSLQPLEVLCVPPYTLGEVEYCGLRYFTCAVNLWVNVLDKAPPGLCNWSIEDRIVDED